ncbi:MAG: BolA family transcriptional regulator [Thiotrichales bacterium]|nr:BolA family transcriptional regulator [Thiotrichales bacterium]
MSPEERVEQIRASLEKALNPLQLDIVDNSAAHAGHAGNTGGGHFDVSIVSDQFNGKSTIERHRMVYMAVNHMMPAEIHALSIRALAPDET